MIARFVSIPESPSFSYGEYVKDPIELSRYITKLLEDYYNSDAAKIISILNEEDRKRAAKILFYVFCGDYNLANYKQLAFKRDQKRINSDTREIYGRNK